MSRTIITIFFHLKFVFLFTLNNKEKINSLRLTNLAQLIRGTRFLMKLVG